MNLSDKELLNMLGSHNDLVVMLGVSENMAHGILTSGKIPSSQLRELLLIKLGLHDNYELKVHHEIAAFCDELLGLHFTKAVELETLYFKYRDWCNWRVGEPDIKCMLIFSRMVITHMNKKGGDNYPTMKTYGPIIRNVEVMEGCYELS